MPAVQNFCTQQQNDQNLAVLQLTCIRLSIYLVRGKTSLDLFSLTALWSTALASSTLPLCSSHRGDSSIRLGGEKALDFRSPALSEPRRVFKGVVTPLQRQIY